MCASINTYHLDTHRMYTYAHHTKFNSYLNQVAERDNYFCFTKYMNRSNRCDIIVSTACRYIIYAKKKEVKLSEAIRQSTKLCLDTRNYTLDSIHAQHTSDKPALCMNTK